jgi:transcriptional regulator with XRE-family HTH domain
MGTPSEWHTLGQELQSIRKQTGMSLDKAAAAIGCTKSYLWNLEKDRAEPGLRIAARIAGAYGVPIAIIAAALVREDEDRSILP